MKKKLLIALLAITTAFCGAFGFTACDNNNNGGIGDNSSDTEQSGDIDKEFEKLGGSEGLEYTLSDDGTYYYFSGLGTCTDTEITIANYYNDLPVKQIGKYVVSTSEEAQEILDENISEELVISLYMFANSNVTSIIIPEGIMAIGVYAFADIEGGGSLKHISIPESVIKISSGAFVGCSGLTSIVIPDSVTEIGDGAFDSCSGLTNINYNGTKEQWSAIKKSAYWDSDTGKYTIHCTDGDIAKD